MPRTRATSSPVQVQVPKSPGLQPASPGFLSPRARTSGQPWCIYPPFSNVYVIFCSGELDGKNVELVQKIHSFKHIIAVDGGLNHIHDLNTIFSDEEPITPLCILGDCDSVLPEILAQYENLGTLKDQQPRLKDFTDLEEAIRRVKTIDRTARIIILGGLGGRIDHTLVNIYLLLRYPGRIFLESDRQVLFAVNSKSSLVTIDPEKYKRMTLIALSGPIGGVSLKSSESTINLTNLDFSSPKVIPLNGKCEMSIETGEIIVILDKETKPLQPPCADNTETYVDFSLKTPLSDILQWLAALSIATNPTTLCSQSQEVHLIQNQSGEVKFNSERGLTVSLIPVDGQATGITTTGLKWDLNPNTPYNKLHRNFLSISNVALGTSFTVKVTSGKLLCIINKLLIDTEMANTPFPTGSNDGNAV